MFIINEKRVKRLERILANYSDILSEFGIKEQIIKAYSFEKPLTSIEVYSEDNDRVEQFVKELENFFFVGRTYFEPDSQEFGFSGLIFISRFKNLLDVVLNYANDHNGLLDKFADLSGIIFGYSSEEVVKYCSQVRLKKSNLIK